MHSEIIMKKYILAFVSLLLITGCVSIPKSDWTKVAERSRSEQVNFPAIGIEKAQALGDVLVASNVTRLNSDIPLIGIILALVLVTISLTIFARK